VSAIDASSLLRPGLLEGVSVLLAGVHADLDSGSDAGLGDHASFGGHVAAACAGLGARIWPCELPVDGPAGEDHDPVERATRELLERALADARSVDLLAVDCAGVFARAGRGRDRREQPRVALRACLTLAWTVTRTVASGAFLPGERGGRVVYVTPPPTAGEHAEAARAGLENLARTLSIEWARHAITTVAIAPRDNGEETADEVAALTAYLASPAGAYFSGCLLDLRGPARTAA
jgi:NAD(P)-dependent dehydrogenase (short-subunit alcohol dehydrogenase family)